MGLIRTQAAAHRNDPSHYHPGGYPTDAQSLSMTERLFVYGTLRKNAAHPMHRLLRRHARFESQATFPGRMFDLGDYPGVVPDSAGTHRVLGELYSFQAPALLLPALDRYEGCTDFNDPPQEFRRERHRVFPAGTSGTEAWIYIFNQPVDGLRLIPGGDYMHYMQS